MVHCGFCGSRSNFYLSCDVDMVKDLKALFYLQNKVSLVFLPHLDIKL